jgi:hypothetical protein
MRILTRFFPFFKQIPVFSFGIQCYAYIMHLHGADNKLGQFLGQDIEASANHRNVLRYSLESYLSLVSHNVSKPSLVTKICRQSTKLQQLSKKLCAPGRNQQGIEKFLKVHRPLVYLLKTVLNKKPGYWGGRCHSVQN